MRDRHREAAARRRHEAGDERPAAEEGGPRPHPTAAASSQQRPKNGYSVLFQRRGNEKLTCKSTRRRRLTRGVAGRAGVPPLRNWMRREPTVGCCRIGGEREGAQPHRARQSPSKVYYNLPKGITFLNLHSRTCPRCGRGGAPGQGERAPRWCVIRGRGGRLTYRGSGVGARE